MSVVRILEAENTLFLWQSHSGAHGLSVVWRLFVSRRVHYGRFQCTMTLYFLVNPAIMKFQSTIQFACTHCMQRWNNQNVKQDKYDSP